MTEGKSSVRVYIDVERPSGAAVLEGRLQLPESENARGVVLCHPHPAGGGCMDVQLIRRIAEELSSCGWAVLRFNYCGVGASRGEFTDGVEEPHDVKAAFDYLSSRPEVEDEEVSLAGWSFGSWMALLALSAGLPATSCVAIAPPLIACEWRTVPLRLAAVEAQRHYIVGDRDQFCPVDELEKFVSAVSEQDLRQVKVLEGADHFLFGREDEVASLVADRL